MGLLDALRKRSSAVRFSFSITLHTLSPWPESGKAVAVAWQRGSKKKKRGVTEAQLPVQVQGQLGTAVAFRDVIQFAATLYMENNAAPTPNGPFNKKCLILAVIESGGAYARDTTPLGRVVLDLAEFAGMENEVKRNLPVACSRLISNAVGEPQLSLTIKCLWKSTGGPASMASSMSSDRTGGTFTTNFSAFIRNNQNEQMRPGMTNDQRDELRGFRLNTIRESEHDMSVISHIRTQESEKFHVEDFVPSPNAGSEKQFDGETSSKLSMEHLRHHQRQLSSEGDGQGTDAPGGEEVVGGRTGAWLSGLDVEMSSPTTGLIEAPEVQKEEPSQPLPVPTAEDAESLSSGAPAREALSDGGSDDVLSSSELFGHKIEGLQKSSSLEERFAAVSPIKGSRKNQEATPPKRGAAERRWKRASPFNEEIPLQSPSRSSSPSRSLRQGRRATTPERAASPLRTPLSMDGVSTSLLAELRSAAFLEYAIYLARPGLHKYTRRNVLSPARRIMKGMTALCSGEEEMLSLLQCCLHAVRVTVEACGNDVPGLAFWWGNCFQLRLYLSQDRCWSPGLEPTEWALRRMLQLIIKMEKSIFDRLQQYLWWKIFVPHVSVCSPDPKRSSYHEGSGQKWLDALYAVHEQFALVHSHEELGHLQFLRRKIIGNCCRMMDALLFRELLSGATQGEFFFEGSEDAQPRSWPKLPAHCLPFKKGPLTFGVGMHLKMAITRWSEWAIEANMKEPQHTGDPGLSFFPSLKATADLLMMPKELLTDEAMRGELFAALSIQSMCILLEKFQPDEFAPDPVNPDVLESLTARLNKTFDDNPNLSINLQEPPFELKAEGGDADSDPELDSEGEGEMESLGRSFPTHDGGISRFELLKEQWSVVRKR